MVWVTASAMERASEVQVRIHASRAPGQRFYVRVEVSKKVERWKGTRSGSEVKVQ